MFRSLTSRLTVWYGGLFAVLALTFFALFYGALSSRLQGRIDAELSDDAREIADFLHNHDTAQVQEFVAEEVTPDGVSHEFIRILTPDGESLAGTDLSAWSGLPESLQDLNGAPGPGQTFLTVKLPERADTIRVISRRLADGRVVQLGVSLEDDEELLAYVRKIFGLVAVAMVFVGGGVGWFMAKRALAGVERVTDTALGIKKGDLARRVSVGNEGAEIERLAKAFNTMLDQIHVLLAELREVTQNIAHDLRSPLTRIRGVCETTLRSEASVEEYRDMAATVIEEADRLVNMINIMLDIAEMDSGAVSIARTPVDLNELIADVAELYEPVADDKDIVINVESGARNALIRGDAPRLQRVFANLLDNAIKYTPAGGRISLEMQADTESVRISIKDSGIGMDSETRKRAFDRFYRGDPSRSLPGNGLGLSLARAFVRAHNGDITAESIPGHGTVFSVVLPHLPS